MMDKRGKSDSPVLPGKPPNKVVGTAAEVVEGRGLAKGNSPESNASRTQSRNGALSALERVRHAAQEDRKQRFTALLHHVYNVARLRAAYYALKRQSAPGVDGETWRHYGEALEENLQSALARGYAGACPRSFSGTDGYGRLPHEPLLQFARRHPDLVNRHCPA